MTRCRLILASAVLLVLAALPLLAQPSGASLTGSLVDESGAALPGVTVTINGPGGAKQQITGGDGRFSFAGVAPGTYTLTAALPGFGTISRNDVVVGETAAELPAMTMKIALRGEEVVVSASKIESSLVNAPATMSVITADTIAASPAQNYGDLLRSVPGVNVIQMSSRDINLTARQATSTLTSSQLTLLDGRSIYLDFFGLVLWDFVPTAASEIKQIEVVRGPASAVWGANALTGVVNIITKSPREAPGGNVTLNGGFFDRDAGSTAGEDSGNSYGISGSWAGAPNDRWSYRLAAGFYHSEPFARPVGFVPGSPLITGGIPLDQECTQVGHPLDPTILTGCATYPADRDPVAFGEQVFKNTDTNQPKVDARVDQELSNGGRLSYTAGYAGTQGIVHTGIGPFGIESDSYMGYGRIAYTKGALKVAGFVNLVNAKAASLLLPDPEGRPVRLDFKTNTYDFEVGHSTVVGGNHILSYGGNARHNDFDITLTPNSEDRSEFGAYFQDEIFFDKFRFALGGRVDKFGNIEDPVFSPRLSAMFKPTPAHSFRVSYNRAFRSPSVINNFLDQSIIGRIIDLRPLTPLVAALAPALLPEVAQPFPLIVQNLGNVDLKEESVTAYEIAYTGTFNGKTTVGLAVYQNDQDDNINFVSLVDNPTLPGYEIYTPADPPPGVSPQLTAFLALVPPQFGGPILFPKVGGHYLNLGPTRQKGLEASIDHAFNTHWTAFANYSWQDTPEILDADADQIPYPTSEVGIPAENRFNAGVNFNDRRFLGSLSLNYSDKAFWVDVLDRTFAGYTDSYTMVNASFGVKWNEGRVVTAIKGTNITNESIQQHNFGDVLRRSLVGEVQVRF